MIGFINGCFDIIHVGHVEILKFAKQNCDYLIVALDTDERIKNSKGDSRPFNALLDRKKVIESIRYIDEVRDFSTDDELRQMIKEINPDVMIEGEEYRDKNIIGSENAKKILFFRRLDEHSTTKILESSSDR